MDLTPESGSHRAANRAGIRARIGGPEHPESGMDRKREAARAAPPRFKHARNTEIASLFL